MPTYYCDDYERITGQKPPVEGPAEEAEQAEKSTKDVTPDSADVVTK